MTEETPTPKPASRFDLQDAVLLAGVILLIAGIAHFSWAVALIVLGLILLGFSVLIAVAKGDGSKKPNPARRA